MCAWFYDLVGSKSFDRKSENRTDTTWQLVRSVIRIRGFSFFCSTEEEEAEEEEGRLSGRKQEGEGSTTSRSVAAAGGVQNPATAKSASAVLLITINKRINSDEDEGRVLQP